MRTYWACPENVLDEPASHNLRYPYLQTSRKVMAVKGVTSTYISCGSLRDRCGNSKLICCWLSELGLSTNRTLQAPCACLTKQVAFSIACFDRLLRPSPCSLFPVPCSPFPVPCSPFPVPRSPGIGMSRPGVISYKAVRASSSMAEQRPFKPWVLGSSPRGLTEVRRPGKFDQVVLFSTCATA
jgi:hypothetical protein